MGEEGMKARRRRASRPYENKKIYMGFGRIQDAWLVCAYKCHVASCGITF